MAVTQSISQLELKRQAELSYEGKTFKCFAADNSIAELTAEDALVDWEDVEITTAGYQPITGTVGVGAFNTTTARYELPSIEAVIQATEEEFTYDTVVLALGTATHVHSIIQESTPITLLVGQSKTYIITLYQDDG